MCGWKDAASIITTIGSVALPAAALLQKQPTAPDTGKVDTGNLPKVDKDAAAKVAIEDRRRLLALRGKSSTVRTPANLGPLKQEDAKYRTLLGGM